MRYYRQPVLVVSQPPMGGAADVVVVWLVVLLSVNSEDNRCPLPCRDAALGALLQVVLDLARSYRNEANKSGKGAGQYRNNN